MKFTIEIPDDKFRDYLDALWFASRQREKLDSNHQELLHHIGKQINQQKVDATFAERNPHLAVSKVVS